ncbi:hypothetical protein [Virgibacillus dokdonensis]|uniref:hypothetical protein n=1 Tax=Virgibacillus dokdonensis TaxID=302167 RepID=UPI00098A7791|nr:hypothetical protein [Virgibacillus dokdonensis]
MNQMEIYYVIKRTTGKDEQFTLTDAMSLDKADAFSLYVMREKNAKDGFCYLFTGVIFFVFILITESD